MFWTNLRSDFTPRDNQKLIETLHELRDLGNTVLVVEHDEETIERADHVIDLGPLAGTHGGEIIAEGTPKDIKKSKDSLTGKYMSGKLKIEIPEFRRLPNGANITVKGAKAHNLKNIDVTFPLGIFTVVTGVSGSGKSTLVEDILYPALYRYVYKSAIQPLEHDSIEGLELVDKIIEIDQSPIGRTPRSNPATYAGVFTPIRELYAMLPESRERGYKAGRFSFNVKGGRCEACEGDGMKRIEMNFLPDVYVTCDVCRGARYNRETLSVKYKGLSIADLLDTTIEDALPILENIPNIKSKLQTLARCRSRLFKTRTIFDDDFRRRSPARQTCQRTFQTRDRKNDLYSRRTDDRTSFCRRSQTARRSAKTR